MPSPAHRFLIVESRFYAEVTDLLVAGAVSALDEAGIPYDRVEVPGALEIPGAIAMAADGTGKYDGFIALGCVIRGQTSHYETVCAESARGLMDLTLRGLAVSNGILTVENDNQAMERADPARKNKGGDAARAAIALAAIAAKSGGASHD